MRQICESLRILAGQRLGLDLSRTDDLYLIRDLEEAAAEWGLEPLLYLEQLGEEPCADKIWTPLIDRLTIAETYFFRDQGQMNLLRNTILPELLQQCQGQGRRMRVWSAGCSSGEEIYSVAMMLDSLNALTADLMGTDVNSAILEQAARGVCRERSLRNLPDGYLHRYFQSKGGQIFQLNKRLRDNVAFHVHNLADPPSSYLHGLDLVICRNVMIYFRRDILATVLDGFYRALRPGGLLMTGHGETLSTDHPFESEIHAQSVVHRKPALPSGSGPKPAHRVAQPTTPETSMPSSEQRLAPTVESYLWQARQHRKSGDTEQAREALSKAIYLDPDLGEAYLELALLHLDEAPEKSRKHRATALTLLFKRGVKNYDLEVEESLKELERRLP